TTAGRTLIATSRPSFVSLARYNFSHTTRALSRRIVDVMWGYKCQPGRQPGRNGTAYLSANAVFRPERCDVVMTWAQHEIRSAFVVTPDSPWPTSFRLQSSQVGVDNLEPTNNRREFRRCGTPS